MTQKMPLDASYRQGKWIQPDSSLFQLLAFFTIQKAVLGVKAIVVYLQGGSFLKRNLWRREIFVCSSICLFCLILRLLQLASISDHVPSAACVSPELCTHSPQTSGTSLISVCMAYSPLHGNSFRYPYQRKEMAPISRFFTAKQVIAISLTVKYL